MLLDNLLKESFGTDHSSQEIQGGSGEGDTETEVVSEMGPSSPAQLSQIAYPLTNCE